MTNKNTKRALLTSVMSLLLCFTMLLGTTYAWFTDSVSSANNIITAGNLDISLEYYNGSKWEDVDGSDELFDGEALWEPGHTEVVYLKLENKGSLALSYQLGVNIAKETLGINVDGNPFKLSQYINLGVVEMNANEFFNSREEAIAAAEATADAELEKVSSAIINGYTANGVMTKETPKAIYLALVVYMPEEVGNNVNYMTGTTAPEIQLGVNVFATQYTYEKDSFGSDYDAVTSWADQEATYDWYNPSATTYKLNSVSDLVGFMNLVNGTAGVAQDSFKNKTVELGVDIDLQNKAWTPIGNSTYKFEGIFDGNGKTIKNLFVPGHNSNVGFFGNTASGEVKNLTVENAKVSGRLNVAVVAGQPYTTKYTNITVKGHVEVDGMSYVGCVGGKNAYADWNNITVNADATSYVKALSVENCTAYRTYVGGVIGFMGEGSHVISNVTSNIDVIGSTCDVGGLVGIAHYDNKFENCKVSGDVTISDAMDAEEAEEIGGLAGVWHNATGHTVTFNGCAFTGTLTANITEGVNLSNNTITGKAYSNSGVGVLVIDGVETVRSQDKLIEALGKLDGSVTEVTVSAGTYTFPTSSLSAGVTLNCEEGTVFTGNSKLNINGATVVGATFSNPTGTAVDQTINGVFKNCVFEGSNALRWCYAGDTVVFENCVFSGDVYGVHFDGGANEVIFRNCVFSGFNALGGAITQVTMEGCTFKSNGKSGYNGINMWGNAKLTNCTFLFDGTATYEWFDLCGADKTAVLTDCVVFDGVNTTGVEGMVSKREASATLIVNDKLCVLSADELAAALTSDAANISVVLLADIDLPINTLGTMTGGSGEYKLGGEGTEKITIDLNGKKLNITTTYWSVLGAKNDNAVFTIKNGTMTSSQASGTWNSYDLCFANCNYVMENVVFDKAIALEGAGKTYTLTNVTINETHDYYALWISAKGQTVNIDGLTINSAGRGIKIDEQYVSSENLAKVILNVSNAEFNTVKKAAIMVKSAAGAEIALANVNIADVAADNTNAVWVDSDAAAYANLVTVTGGSVITEA